jgi:hypothetical protein
MRNRAISRPIFDSELVNANDLTQTLGAHAKAAIPQKVANEKSCLIPRSVTRVVSTSWVPAALGLARGKIHTRFLRPLGVQRYLITVLIALNFYGMSTVAEIEKALRGLPVKDARTVAAWLQDYLDEQWDRQIEADASSGKLDKLREQALAHYKAGRVKPLDEVIDNS